jgi:hypothetical protein
MSIGSNHGSCIRMVTVECRRALLLEEVTYGKFNGEFWTECKPEWLEVRTSNPVRYVLIRYQYTYTLGYFKSLFVMHNVHLHCIYNI